MLISFPKKSGQKKWLTMKDIVHFEPVIEKTFDTYIRVGTKAYNQHYLHLWPNANSFPYINSSFTLAVLKKESADINTQLFLIKRNKEYVGILKLITDLGLDGYSNKEGLYLDKIYLIKEASGMGIGSKTLQFVELRAKKAKKQMVWLATMQKGRALNFYKKNGFHIHGSSEIKFEQAVEAEKSMFIMLKKLD